MGFFGGTPAKPPTPPPAPPPKTASSGMVSVLDFGADPTGASDSAPAFTAALRASNAVRVPAGSYRIDSAVRFTFPGSVLRGDGRSVTLLFVSSKDLSKFGSMETGGVLVAAAGEGPIITDLAIRFDNDLDPVSRADLLPNRPAINWNGAVRGTMAHLRISRAFVGVLLPGNAGGVTLEDVEMSSLSVGLDMPGESLDSVKVTRWHQWWFDFGTQHQKIAADGKGLSLSVYRCDDLHVSDSLFFSEAVLLQGGFGGFSNCDFDNASTLRMSPMIETCSFSFTGCFFSNNGVLKQPQVVIEPSVPGEGNNAEVSFTGCAFQATDMASLGQPLITIGGTTTLDDYLSVNFAGCNFRWADNPSAGAVPPLLSLANAFVTITGTRFFPMTRAYQAPPVILASNSCRIAVAGCAAYDWGSPPRPFLAVDPGTIWSIAGCVLPGYSLP